MTGNITEEKMYTCNRPMLSPKEYRVNSPNTGCLPNIRNGPQSGPPLYSKAKGREVAHQFIMGPKAACRPNSFMQLKTTEWLIIV